MVPNFCSIFECGKPTRYKSLCGAHYRRKRLYGDPIITLQPGRGLSPAQKLDLYTSKSDGCWIWQGGGVIYGKMVINGRTMPAHVMAYKLHVGPVPDGYVVRHKCDIPKCVRPDHLEVGTYADNSKDMTDRDRQAKGRRQWCAKMTEDSVAQLRVEYSTGIMTITQLSKHYGLATSTVGKIIQRVTWKHVPEMKAI